jgi:hypothetical protein
LNKEKSVANEGIANEAVEYLKQRFEGIEYLNKKSEIMPISLYCSSLYLQLDRLAQCFNMDSAKTKAGGISGISKRGFTTKDFMSRFTTGDNRRATARLMIDFGTPVTKIDSPRGDSTTHKSRYVKATSLT